MPALAALCGEQHEGGWLAWVSPPYQPYAPALAACGIDIDRVLVVRSGPAAWVMEQALRSGSCSAVLGWVNAIDMSSLRRLQLAAEQGLASPSFSDGCTRATSLPLRCCALRSTPVSTLSRCGSRKAEAAVRYSCSWDRLPATRHSVRIDHVSPREAAGPARTYAVCRTRRGASRDCGRLEVEGADEMIVRSRVIWARAENSGLPYTCRSSCSKRCGDISLFSEKRSVPFVVVDQERGGKVVCACNAAAAADGIGTGMALNSALALQPGLTLRDRDQRRERELLETIAEWAVRYSPRVSLEPPDTVLLEVRGSLRLFGGSRRLLARMRAELRGRARAAALAHADTAGVALVRAGGRGAHHRSPRGPRGPASVAAARLHALARTQPRTLATMGVRTVGDCLRLPRDGFARRFEPRMLDMLDRALGRRPDPRDGFIPRERFAAERDLEPEIADTAAPRRGLRAAARRALCAFCGSVDAACRHSSCGSCIAKRRRRACDCALWSRWRTPSRIAALLRERLARLVLPAPVRALRLRSGPLVESREASTSSSRWTAANPVRACRNSSSGCGRGSAPRPFMDSAWFRSIARNRPGASRSRPLPAAKTRNRGPASEAEMRAGQRSEGKPLWLLAEPQLLDGGEQPRFEGALELEEGPERIESGWWDGRDVRATTTSRAIRRVCGSGCSAIVHPSGRWFLHGVFG